MVQLDAKIMSVGAVILAVIIALGVVTLLILNKPDEGLIVLFSSILGAFFGGGVVHTAATPVLPEFTKSSLTPSSGGTRANPAPLPTTPGSLSTSGTEETKP